MSGVEWRERQKLLYLWRLININSHQLLQPEVPIQLDKKLWWIHVWFAIFSSYLQIEFSSFTCSLHKPLVSLSSLFRNSLQLSSAILPCFHFQNAPSRAFAISLQFVSMAMYGNFKNSYFYLFFFKKKKTSIWSEKPGLFLVAYTVVRHLLMRSVSAELLRTLRTNRSWFTSTVILFPGHGFWRFKKWLQLSMTCVWSCQRDCNHSIVFSFFFEISRGRQNAIK